MVSVAYRGYISTCAQNKEEVAVPHVICRKLHKLLHCIVELIQLLSTTAIFYVSSS